MKSSSKSLLYVTFRHKWSFKWHCNTIKTLQSIDEINDVQMMMWGWRWWVIESVFLLSPNKGFWACLGDPPPDILRRPETWVSLCNLMLKLRNILRSSAILGSDSPQSNNRKGKSIHSPCERRNVIKHAIAGYLGYHGLHQRQPVLAMIGLTVCVKKCQGV